MRIKPLIFWKYISHLCKEEAEDPFSCEEKTQIKIQEAINSLGDKLSQSIRYPHNYYPVDTPKGGTSLSEVHKILQSECPECQKLRFGEGSPGEFERLIPLLEQQKSSCLKNIIKNMFKQLKSYRLPKSCKKDTTHPVCEKMSKDYNLIQDRLLRLTELIYGKSARLKTQAELCTDCPRPSKGENSKGLDRRTIEDIWTQSRNCEELKPGEKKRVSSGTALNKEYLVQMEDDGSYTITLNLQFVAADDYKGDVERDKVPSHYRNLVKECLKEVNEKLLGPNGEKMRIVLKETSSEKSSCPEPPEIVKIGPPDILSSSDRYASNIDCPVVLSHEVLHQTGLCDEYFNNKKGYIMDTKTGKIITEVEDIYKEKNLDPDQSLFLAYDCRVIRTNSVMANSYHRWGNVHRGVEASLVTPEQFSAILYGDCRSKNQLFNECSKLAYRNSFEDKTCLEKKEECKKQNALGSQ